MFRKIKKNQGFTYVELIVVLGIFAMVTGTVLFDYKKFQSKVDIKNLSNDIALKFVETQKSSLDGKWHSSAGATWKPSYGMYFNLTTGTNTGNQVFYYFVDLDQDKQYDKLYTCPLNECLEKFTLTKGNTISELRVYYTNSNSAVTNLDVTFTRPNSGATFYSSGVKLNSVSYAQVTVTSPRGVTALVKLYASGRIQIN